MNANLAASVRVRLLNLAKAERSDFNQMLVRFALERMLYRLSQSVYAGQFLLKGALLFTLWYDEPHRPTRDADLLGFGPSDLDSLQRTFAEIAGIVVDDGIVFDSSSVQVDAIRKEAGYGGARVLISGESAKARCKIQIDIGFGDAVTPGPIDATFPVLLDDLPAPHLRTYPVYTIIAEKVHAIALLGMANTRLKDYLDLAVLFERENLDPDLLATALQSTFNRRRMAMPTTLPAGLSSDFAEMAGKQAMWKAMLHKNKSHFPPFNDVVRGAGGTFETIFSARSGRLNFTER